MLTRHGVIHLCCALRKTTALLAPVPDQIVVVVVVVVVVPTPLPRPLLSPSFLFLGQALSHTFTLTNSASAHFLFE
jgi:hypothetical protein